jgi:hypothetical protein
MTRTNRIQFTNALGQVITFDLERKGATEASVLFPVSGYRFRWNFSRFSFGGLNQIVTLDIVDEDDEFFNLFNSNDRQDVRIKILVDGNELFRGYPDYQQVTKFKYQEGKKEFTVTFYNSLAFLNRVRWDSQRVLDAFANFPDDGTSLATRFHRFFRDLVFAEYDDLIYYTYNWTHQVSAASMPDADFQLFNQMWFRRAAFEDTNVTDVMNLISRSFWFRYGYSYFFQAPHICKIDTGFNLDSYTTSEVTDAVSSSGGFFVNECDNFALEVDDFYTLDENLIDKFDLEPTESDEEPYSEIKYIRSGDVDFEIENPVFKSILLDDFVGNVIPFDPTSAAADDSLAVLGLSGATIVSTQPNGFADPNFDPADFMDLPEINAKLHMRWREIIRPNNVFSYQGILDPTLNYRLNLQTIALVRGEYDLMKGTTIVGESIALHNTLSDGLVALYRFNEGSGSVAIDLAPSTIADPPNNGTITGATYVQGVSGTGLEFDGVDDFVNIPHKSNQMLTGGGAISAWINPRTLGTDFDAGRIIDKSTAPSSANGFRFQLTSSNRIQWTINNGTNVVSGNNAITFNEWQHVLVVFSSTGESVIYVNGVQVASGTTANASGITTTNDVRIGTASVDNRRFDGLIDEVRLYNRVLSLEEIQYLYKNKV